MTDDRPKRSRSKPKLMTKAEQDEAARQHETARLGRVAHHRGETDKACPYPEGDPLRLLWLDGLAKAKSRPLRLDMTPARAKGDAAFRDGLHPHECPISSRSPERSEWNAGYEAARAHHEKDEAERSR
jgi:hypothetical protein